MANVEELWENLKRVDANVKGIIAGLKAIAEDEQSEEKIEAQCKLGWIYYKDIRAPIDYAEAIKWFEKAAQKGHPVAQFYLGEIWEVGGYGLIPNLLCAFVYYSLAVENDCMLLRLDTSNGAEFKTDEKIAIGAKNRVGSILVESEKILEADTKLTEWKQTNPDGFPQ